MTSDLLQQLEALPSHWAYVAVDGQKRAYQRGWQRKPLTREQVAAEIRSGRARAVGVCAGPPSGGILFLDHDGLSATAELERLGLPLADLPRTWAMTSGRDGRFQAIYTVPRDYWPAMRSRRVFKTGHSDADGKAENLDLRWVGHYSVVIGDHPQTSGYRWLTHRSPAEQELNQAPLALIELLLEDPEPEPDPLLALAPAAAAAPQPPLPPSPAGPLPLLDFITRDSRQLIESGGTPGSWNDDQLRLSLDLRGTEDWLLQQGAQLDLTASQAFALHIQAAAGKARDFDERKAWARFDGAAAHNPTPGTPVEKLQSRLRYHRRQRTKKAEALPQAPAPSHSLPPQPTAPVHAKAQRLEPSELLALLRKQGKAGELRWNRFTQSVELNGQALTGLERYYLVIAEMGYKVSKELAIDCVVKVAQEYEYDPVTEYLDHVAATVDPTYIDALATTYLRPEDHAGAPTLYDHMIRCTLIGAVRRAFEPGAKHDTACVLMGDQGARKSSFWSALGGRFFSDSLGDCTSKDDLMKLHRSWIMEWAELDHIMGRRHAGQVKAFLSQSTDLFRQPYARATESFPRRGIIVGSTNRQTGFLQDETGNRRFWCIPTTRTEADPIDTPQLAAERDSIWAAAVAAYRRGDPSWLPPELAGQVAVENDAYQVSNPWEPAIAQWLATRPPGEVITSEAALSEAVERPIDRQTRADQMAVSDILRRLGYERRRIMDGGRRIWRWHRIQ